jgi:hypothetical protein
MITSLCLLRYSTTWVMLSRQQHKPFHLSQTKILGSHRETQQTCDSKPVFIPRLASAYSVCGIQNYHTRSLLSLLKNNITEPPIANVDCRGSISCRGKIFFFLHSVQTCSSSYPASYPMCTGALSTWGKQAGAWSWPFTSIYCRG